MFSGKTDKNQLGLYWGKDGFCLAETEKGAIAKIAYVRFDTPGPGEQGAKIPETLRITSLIQNTLRDKKFTCKKAVLTISAKDIVYRSFVIPFMQPQEVKNVVDFEITKYIPIKLTDLSFNFHTIPFTDGEQKNLRVLFVAVRQNILERYIGLMTQAGLEVAWAEPASVSLVRLLSKTETLPRNQSIAIVEIEKEGGRIIILDKEIVQFVRELQSPVAANGELAENTKFLNDIRVSFNFYQRQNTQAKIEKLLFISSINLSSLPASAEQEFKIPSIMVTTDKLIKNEPVLDLGMLSAGGAAMREGGASTKNFDLPIKSHSSASPNSALGITSGPLADWNIPRLLGSLAFAGILVFLSITLNQRQANDTTNHYNELKSKVGIYASSTPEKINELADAAKTKLDQYKSIRLNSQIADFMALIPTFIPTGTWLSSFSVEYSDAQQSIYKQRASKNSKLIITLEGYVYLINPNEQIKQINLMVTKIKSNKTINKIFDSIDSTDVRTDIINNYPVTFFRITCK